MFKIIKKSKISKARAGIVKTPHGDIKTPFFMPDATRGVVKNLSSSELKSLGLACPTANTLHLFLRPGAKLIKQAGGLHKFMSWPRPILTDSGGFQVFSLIHNSGLKGRITDSGAVFKSPLDGSLHKLTPEQSIKSQFDFGADMMVCLDDCPPNDFNKDKLKIAVERTILWAKRCRREFDKQIKARGLRRKPLLFAVIQGGNDLALRKYCAQELIKIGFDGYGFGARHVDETGNFLDEALEFTAEQIPENKLRFGLGIGKPEDIARAVKLGWDMFDCVIPTREGRHGRLFQEKGSKNGKFSVTSNNFYDTVNITNARYAYDLSPINHLSSLEELRNYTKGYLHFLFKIKETLALRLAGLNNLEFYFKMLTEIRGLIVNNKF